MDISGNFKVVAGCGLYVRLPDEPGSFAANYTKLESDPYQSIMDQQHSKITIIVFEYNPPGETRCQPENMLFIFLCLCALQAVAYRGGG